MIYPDSHFHLLSLKERGVTLDPNVELAGIDVGTTARDYDERKEIIKLFNIHYSLGSGPWCANKEESIYNQLATLEQYVKNLNPVAIGEIGLDYYWDYGDRKTQQELFIEQLKMANRYSLPVIIHTRDADEDTAKILSEHKVEKGGIMHCFSSHSLDFATLAISKGFYISFSGNVTFKNNRELQEVARHIPLDKLLAETDSPYLAPTPMRGRINQPEYVRYVYEFLAKLKGVELEELRLQLISNLEEFYTRSQK